MESLRTRRWLSAVSPGGRGGLDLPGAALAAGGVTLLSYALVMTGAHAWSSAMVAIPLVAGPVLLAVFAVVELRAEDPLLPLALLAGRHRVTALFAILSSPRIEENMTR